MKILALFLGATQVSEKTLNPLIKKWQSENFAPLHGKFVGGHELKFDSDWNWILPVVKKLHQVNNTLVNDDAHKALFHMLMNDIVKGIIDNNIDRVSNDCIELVKYINIHKIKF